MDKGARSLIFPARRMFTAKLNRPNLVEIFHDGTMAVKGADRIERSTINGIKMEHYTLDLAEIDDSSISELERSFPFTKQIVGRMKINEREPAMPRLMGVVNATPDSFYPGSRVSNTEELDRIIDSKPDIIDIGGESTRPGSKEVPYDVEIDRLKPVIDYISSTSQIPISLDSRHPKTVRTFSDRIDYINDISGFTDRDMVRIASEFGLKCIIMHMRGTPENMQENTNYGNIVPEIIYYLYDRTLDLMNSGIPAGDIIVDPGIGFAKDFWGNADILRDVRSFQFGPKLLVGASRKGFIGKITGEHVEGRLPGTIATSIYLAMSRVDFIRVHDVVENREALETFNLLSGSFKDAKMK